MDVLLMAEKGIEKEYVIQLIHMHKIITNI